MVLGSYLYNSTKPTLRKHPPTEKGNFIDLNQERLAGSEIESVIELIREAFRTVETGIKVNITVETVPDGQQEGNTGS